MASNKSKPLAVGDRVACVSGGPKGVIREIREESKRPTLKESTQDDTTGTSVVVLWDNGTLSHFAPGALEHTK